ncbi:hypothetical protein [Curtobacterium sp. MCBD17_040]|uniref:hypothetical protein n=1 Tax=Curtobacterium sp. MCBD17_040 TaxID=2175674 RepID=UPI000DA98F7B|nr:hypothetical protein [Curtobacterium sp. MCBD17_040]WIB65714.1 hypothetical protein DEI94_16465 [Curtobacterium sp. MCBD17_040]
MTIAADISQTGTPEQPAEVALVSGREAGAKRVRQLNHSQFATSSARQTATLAWAAAEVAAELRDNTEGQRTIAAALTALADATARQADAAERSAAAAERTASLTQLQAMMTFYSLHDRVFPDGVADQFKTLLGIRSTTAEAAAPAARPAPADPAPQVPAFDEFA